MKNEQLKVRRLGWAGVEIEYNNEVIVIDYIQDTTPLIQLRSADEPFPQVSRMGDIAAGLLTHLHADHADPKALQAALRNGAPVFRPEPTAGVEADMALTSYAEEQFAKTRLPFEIVAAWEQRKIGSFTINSAPAVDGFGDTQVSWIVECGGRKIFHTGDTLFHGFWWRIAHRFGPFDVAFLPINGAVVNFPLLQPASPLEAIMTPEQAAIAASILQTKCVVPIHYKSLHKPPMYIETAHPAERLKNRLKELNIPLMLKEPGDWFDLD